jgi:hypothetical protein
MVLARGGAGGGKFGKSSGLIRVIDPGIGVNGFAGKEGTGLVGFSGGGGGGGGGGGTGIAPLVGPRLVISISSTCL